MLSRAAGRFRMLKTRKDFLALEQIILQAQQRVPMRVLAYCLMGNHWLFVVWPPWPGKRGKRDRSNNAGQSVSWTRRA